MILLFLFYRNSTKNFQEIDMDFNFILLLARQRSGTSALGSIMNKHSQSYYLGEPFNLSNFGKPKNFFSYKEAAILADPSLMRPDNNQKLWDGFITTMNKKHGSTGFIDVKYNQTHHLNGDSYLPTNPSWLVGHAFSKKTPVIHLTRKNHLKNFVSVVRAKKTGVWHTKIKQEALDRRVVINTDELKEHISRCENTLMLFDSWMSNRGHVFTIDYSELFGTGGQLSEKGVQGIERITKFEGLGDLKTDFIKQTSDNLESMVENFDEVKASLANTRHAWMSTE